MLKQLAYSGTLEVTQIRKAGLNVRKPLKHFYQYYKVCADDQQGLRAPTVTKRCELLLEQLADPQKCAGVNRDLPLHLAAWRGHTEVCVQLVEAQAAAGTGQAGFSACVRACQSVLRCPRVL